MDNIRNDDNVQHGIDDNPNDDAKKGLELGALGGGTVGAIAGAALGPVGAVVGALIGGSVGGVASGAAVAAVDTVDNDNTISGVGTGATTDVNDATYVNPTGDYERGTYVGGTDVNATTVPDAGVGGHNIVTGGPSTSESGNTGLTAGAIAGGLLGAAAAGPVGAVVGGTVGSLAGGVAGDAAEAADDTNTGYVGTNTTYNSLGNDVPGIQTGGVTTAGADTRGLTEKAADAVTGDYTDDKTGGTIYGSDTNVTTPGNGVPGVQTGGVTTAGADTRGITEKAADAITGDRTDDKTGGIVR